VDIHRVVGGVTLDQSQFEQFLYDIVKPASVRVELDVLTMEYVAYSSSSLQNLSASGTSRSSLTMKISCVMMSGEMSDRAPSMWREVGASVLQMISRRDCQEEDHIQHETTPSSEIILEVRSPFRRAEMQ
jgi:hypothetical protein